MAWREIARFAALMMSEARYNLFLVKRVSPDPRQRRLAIYYRMKAVVSIDRAMAADESRLSGAIRAATRRMAE